LTKLGTLEGSTKKVKERGGKGQKERGAKGKTVSGPVKEEGEEEQQSSNTPDPATTG